MQTEDDDLSLRVSHENNLWKIFRMLAEEEDVPPEVSERIEKSLQSETNGKFT